MQPDATTMPADDNGNDRPRRRRLRRRARGQQQRPLWQEPLRGALYAAGAGIITLLTTLVRDWM